MEPKADSHAVEFEFAIRKKAAAMQSNLQRPLKASLQGEPGWSQGLVNTLMRSILAPTAVSAVASSYCPAGTRCHV